MSINNSSNSNLNNNNNNNNFIKKYRWSGFNVLNDAICLNMDEEAAHLASLLAGSGHHDYGYNGSHDVDFDEYEKELAAERERNRRNKSYATHHHTTKASEVNHNHNNNNNNNVDSNDNANNNHSNNINSNGSSSGNMMKSPGLSPGGLTGGSLIKKKRSTSLVQHGPKEQTLCRKCGTRDTPEWRRGVFLPVFPFFFSFALWNWQ